MKFARIVFFSAGVYGILAIAPLYFAEEQLNADFPPAITHPEYFYGFIGVTLAWQFLFLLISRDVRRYRMVMIPAMVEKFSYAAAGFLLFIGSRVGGMIAFFAGIDFLLGLLFIVAFIATKDQHPA